MTLTTTSNVDRYAAAEGQTAFAYTFRVDDSSHMEVSVDGVVQGSGYTVSNVGNDNGGNVTFTTAPRISGAAAVVVALRRLVPLTNSTNLPTQGALDTDALEAEVDRNVMRIQQLNEVDSRTFKLPVDSTITDPGPTDLVGNGGKFLGVNAGATAVVWGTPAATGVVISTFMQTVVDDVDAASARTTLEVSTTLGATTLTLSADTVTGTRGHHVIAAESGTRDDLDSLATTNYEAGDIVYLRADAGDIIQVAGNAGNFADFWTLSETIPAAFMLIGTKWYLLNRHVNPNLIINGAMQVSQRGTSFGGLTATQYTLDRWEWIDTGTTSGVVTVSQDTDVPTIAQAGTKFVNSLKVDVTTAETLSGANAAFGISHKIEAKNCTQFGHGATGALDGMLSFWFKSTKTGIFTANVDRNDAGGAIVKSW